MISPPPSLSPSPFRWVTFDSHSQSRKVDLNLDSYHSEIGEGFLSEEFEFPPRNRRVVCISLPPLPGRRTFRAHRPEDSTDFFRDEAISCPLLLFRFLLHTFSPLIAGD